MKKPEKLSKEIVDLLLPRLNDEYFAFYAYRAMSNWCQGVGFVKAASYFKAESDDELTHARGIEDFLTLWNVIPELPKVDKPELEFSGLVDAIGKAYQIELDLYEAYEDTSAKILKTGDVCVFDFLQKYRDIQVKSVGEYSDMLNVLEGVDTKSKFELLMLEENLFGE
jgi:ferritin